MKRKVIKQGHNTLTVTLPARWVNANKIKPGDELEIYDTEDKLLKISSTPKSEKSIKEIDVSDLDHNTIRQQLRAIYKTGYDEIVINFSNTTVKEMRTEKEFPIMELLNHEVSNLIGCEVIKQSNNSCHIKDYAVDSELEFENTLRRIFILLEDYGNSLGEQARNLDKEQLKGMRERHFNIAKFIFYCQRLINLGGAVNCQKPSFIYYIVSQLDEILDIMKYSAAELLNYEGKGLQKETVQIMEKIIRQNKNFSNYYYKPTNESLKALVDNRWNVRRQLARVANTLPKFDLFLLINMAYVLEIYYHITEARMALINK